MYYLNIFKSTVLPLLIIRQCLIYDVSYGTGWPSKKQALIALFQWWSLSLRIRDRDWDLIIWERDLTFQDRDHPFRDRDLFKSETETRDRRFSGVLFSFFMPLFSFFCFCCRSRGIDRVVSSKQDRDLWTSRLRRDLWTSRPRRDLWDTRPRPIQSGLETSGHHCPLFMLL